MSGVVHPLSWESLVDYWAGDVDEAQELLIDEHLMGCGECSALSARVAAITESLRAFIPPVLAPETLERLRRRGLHILDNPMQPGERREVRFPRDVDILLHRLQGLALADATQVGFSMRVESSGELLASLDSVPFDRDSGAVLVACQQHFAAVPPDTIAEVRVHRPGGEQVARYTILHHYERLQGA